MERTRLELTQWLYEFQELHVQARQGTLQGLDRAHYLSSRDQLARVMLTAQHIALHPGQEPRHTLRIARALQADLEFQNGKVRALTFDVSAGGFGTLVGVTPNIGDKVKVALRIPGGEPLHVDARVVGVRQQSGSARVDFAFVGIGSAECERMELFVFDVVLDHLRS